MADRGHYPAAPLAHLACVPAHSRGRLHPEADGATRGARTAFQRDRDRIIHAISFRRLRQKTQVFIAPVGDHFRVRMTHSLEVAQIGRTIARILGLNEDLTEALCLAHDIGHPPFGHAGERALDHALADHGGFDHNGQTLRTLMFLERSYPGWPGLNLSWETLEGLAKHNGPVTAPGWALAAADAAFPLDLADYSSLEAQVAAIADDIAYDNHDIDDGLRAQLISLDQLEDEPFVAANLAQVRARFPDAASDLMARELVRDQIGLMVNDLVTASIAAIAAAGVKTPAEVRQYGAPLIGFSPEMAAKERALKSYMYAHLYHHPAQTEAAAQAHRVISGLYRAYDEKPKRLEPGWRETLPQDATARARHIGDYIAGMTDRFALDRFADIYGRGAVPDIL